MDQDLIDHIDELFNAERREIEEGTFCGRTRAAYEDFERCRQQELVEHERMVAKWETLKDI